MRKVHRMEDSSYMTFELVTLFRTIQTPTEASHKDFFMPLFSVFSS